MDLTYADPSQERSTKGEERSEPGEDISDDVADHCQVSAAIRVIEQAEKEGGERPDNPRDDGGDDQDGVSRWCRLEDRSYTENFIILIKS